MPSDNLSESYSEPLPRCIDCGTPVSNLVGGVAICDECLAVRGACCQESGTSDLTRESDAPFADASPAGSSHVLKDEHAIQHEPDAQRFLTQSGARLDYEIKGDRLDITHTFVPERLRGQKLAAHLMEAAIAYARQSRLSLSGSCSYAKTHLKRKGT